MEVVAMVSVRRLRRRTLGSARWVVGHLSLVLDRGTLLLLLHSGDLVATPKLRVPLADVADSLRFGTAARLYGAPPPPPTHRNLSRKWSSMSLSSAPTSRGGKAQRSLSATASPSWDSEESGHLLALLLPDADGPIWLHFASTEESAEWRGLLTLPQPQRASLHRRSRAEQGGSQSGSLTPSDLSTGPSSPI